MSIPRITEIVNNGNESFSRLFGGGLKVLIMFWVLGFGDMYAVCLFCCICVGCIREIVFIYYSDICVVLCISVFAKGCSLWWFLKAVQDAFNTCLFPFMIISFFFFFSCVSVYKYICLGCIPECRFNRKEEMRLALYLESRNLFINDSHK